VYGPFSDAILAVGIDTAKGDILLIDVCMLNILIACHDSVICTICLYFDAMHCCCAFENPLAFNGFLGSCGVVAFDKGKWLAWSTYIEAAWYLADAGFPLKWSTYPGVEDSS
jgi:hypothetical protein